MCSFIHGIDNVRVKDRYFLPIVILPIIIILPIILSIISYYVTIPLSIVYNYRIRSS